MSLVQTVVRNLRGNTDPFIPAETRTTRVACVGDSLTFGYLVENRPKNCYPAKLETLLGPNFSVRNFGVNGHTMVKNGDSPFWKHRNFQLSTEFDPHVVLIMLGSNDSKPHNWTTITDYLRDYRDMIRHYQELPNNPRIYLLTPPMAYTVRHHEEVLFNIQNPILEEISTALHELGIEKQLTVIDIRKATSNHPECFPIDGVHTNAKGAELIATTVYQSLFPNAKVN